MTLEDKEVDQKVQKQRIVTDNKIASSISSCS